MMLVRNVIVLLGSLVLPQGLAHECLASKFGARPSSSEYSTDSLQQAVNTCAAVNGTVVFDRPGVYLLAALVFSGSVHLRIPERVHLLAGTRREDYGKQQDEWYLLRFANCSGCSLSGGGVIDGRARLWVLPQAAAAVRRAGRKTVRNWPDPSCRKATECRPRLVGVVDSTNVSIAGVRLRDPVYWGLHVLRSSHVHISDVNIKGDFWIPNNDGIDIDSSSHVHVTRALVRTADDAICLKTTQAGRHTERVEVSRCRLRSRSSAIKLGSESVADMAHVTFRDLVIEPSHRGLAVQLCDRGSIHNVTFEHVTLTARHYHPSWWGAAEAVSLTAVPRQAAAAASTRPVWHTLAGWLGAVAAHCRQLMCAAPPTRGLHASGSGAAPLGQLTDVRFHNITAVAENGIFFAGWPPGSQTGGACRATEGIRSRRRAALPAPSLSGVTITSMRLELKQLSTWCGGCRDYRPSGRGVDCSSIRSSALDDEQGTSCIGDSGGGTAAVWVEGADGVLLRDVAVRYHSPLRPDWVQSVHVAPDSAGGVVMERVSIQGGPTTM